MAAHPIVQAGAGILGLALGSMAAAQTTDASHSIQIFPVVVDSASFTERLVFHNPGSEQISLGIRYIPAVGTSQGSPLDCAPVTLAPQQARAFVGLRTLCANLAAGSQFGFLYTWNQASTAPFTGYSRVDNANGIGFSVEAFPAHAFTSGNSVVTGLRRRAATPGSPAYQTNCFIGLAHELAPAATQTTVSYSLERDSQEIGVGQVTLTPGKLVRLLDVFAAAGAAPGDYDGVVARFTEAGEGEPGVMAFCTVQDNSSFGADFRIAKQSGGLSHGNLVENVAAQDDSAVRNLEVDTDVRLGSAPGQASARSFAIPPGATSNAHVFYFRHPDYVSCALRDPLSGVELQAEHGLEMRLVASDGTTVLAGGNGTTQFSNFYLGDKRTRDDGANTRYVLEVESNETNTGANRPYRLSCRSGSGQGLGELVRVGGPNLF